MKRRQFLIATVIGAAGFPILGKILYQQINDRTKNNILAESNGTSLAAATPTEAPLLRFVCVADTGTGTKSQYAVARAMTEYKKKNPYNLALMAGDNIYNNGEIEKISAVFERPYQALLKQGVKFHACLGNHDIRTDNGEAQVRYPQFNMQGRYYTFRRGSVQFFALDTNENADWKNQLSWLERELKSSNAPWKVVFGHHQIYSSGLYGLNQDLITNLAPLFQKYRVQLYVNGHEHNYERTQHINGTTYLICGGGAGVRPVGRSSWTAHSVSELSFAAVEVYRDRMIINGINIDNRVFDRGAISV